MILDLFNQWFNCFALCIPNSTPASPFLFPRITSPKKGIDVSYFLHNKFKAPAITATTLDGSRASRSLHRDPPVPAFRLLLFQLLSNVNATPPHQQQHCTSSDLLTDRPPPAAAKVVLPSYSSIRVSSSQEQQHQLAPAVAQSPAPQRASSLNSSVSRQLLFPPPASYQPQAW
ncbi:hypothetical protein NC652_027310 [Populus alba x Populus x berolinensis]|nr:hypothetical protein NC652_027310 [Populus alba x Populus x berolinensis]